MQNKIWSQNQALKSQITLKMPGYIKQFLAQRNILTNEQFQRDILVNQGENDASMIKDSDKFFYLLDQVLNSNQEIVIYGDYDCDGFAATTIALKCIRTIRRCLGDKSNNCHVDYFINDRNMGFGLKPECIDLLLQKYPQTTTIITVDNGISAFNGISYAKEKGIKVLVTDHHEPLPNNTLPDADCICDVKRIDDQYPFKGLSGSGTIYKLFCKYVQIRKYPSTVIDSIKANMDFVGLSVVSDAMPMLNENRIFVKYTLKSFNHCPNVPIRYSFNALLRILTLKKIIPASKEITAETLGWNIVPIINSVSRLTGKIDLVVDIFNSQNESFILKNIQKIIELNIERQTISQRVTEQVLKLLKNKTNLPDILAFTCHDVPIGIIGLIAGKVSSELNHPCIVLTQREDGNYMGSARSVKGISIINVLRNLDIDSRTNQKKIDSPFLSLGGHNEAAGMTINQNMIKSFLFQVINIHLDQDLTNAAQTEYYDLDFKSEDINISTYKNFQMLAPFGIGFEEPVIKTHFTCFRCQVFGKKQANHAKYLGTNITLLDWQGKDRLMEFQEESLLNDPKVEIACLGQMKPRFYNKSLIDIYADDVKVCG